MIGWARRTVNTLYYGDNLGILREQIPAESIDLIYLDPPFNSNRSYNVLFKSRSGKESAAQIEAFDDTWTWSDQESGELLKEMTHHGSVPRVVAETLLSLQRFLGPSDMFAYLVMMTSRLVELHRALKPTGSLYLHCDPTASHYLKIVLDTIFGPKRFLNEISWRRSSAHSDTAQGMKRCGRIRDVILLYSKSATYTWNPVYTPYDESYLKGSYRHVAPDGRRYRESDLTAAKSGGDTEYDWWVKRPKGADVRWVADLDDEHLDPRADWEYLAVRPYKGRYWAYKKSTLLEWARVGKLIHRSTGVPQFMRFADEMPGVILQDDWDDINPASGTESLGYPTQKPLALLERIISASSNPGDVVLDAFCGCGTAVDAAQKLERRWIGIDVTILAIDLIKTRLIDTYGESVAREFRILGTPTELESAIDLFHRSPFEFERWAVTLVDGEPNQKQVGDKGIDGVIRFPADRAQRVGEALVSVKGGRQINPSMVRDLAGTVRSRDAEMGLLLTLSDPTAGMLEAARTSGVYVWPINQQTYPKTQIVTIEDLLRHQRPNMPNATFRPYLAAQKHRSSTHQQLTLG